MRKTLIVAFVLGLGAAQANDLKQADAHLLCLGRGASDTAQ
jgi:hypothetical protein